MGAITAASRAVDTLRRNPVIFAGALFLGLPSLPSYALQTEQIPLLATAWAGVAFFISPFVTGGILGMTAEGLQGGRASAGSSPRGGRTTATSCRSPSSCWSSSASSRGSVPRPSASESSPSSWAACSVAVQWSPPRWPSSPAHPRSTCRSRSHRLHSMYGWGTVSTVVFGAFNNTMLVAFYEAHAHTPT